MTRRRRTIALDFDGVLHKYEGYKNGFIDGPIDGAKDAAQALVDRGHTVVVFTTRDKTTVAAWLKTHGFPALEVTDIKRPFYVIVDDRAFNFGGTWDNDTVRNIEAFQPYWIKAREASGNP
jgi:hypothetical protein